MLLDIQTLYEKPSIINEATWTKSTPKKEIFNQLWQAIKNINEKLDKLTDFTLNLESMLNGIQNKLEEHEIKLNQLEEEKVQLRNDMVQKINLIVFQLDRQEQYIRRENILIYGVEEDKEDNDDGEKVLFSVADELEIYLQPNDTQRAHRLARTKRRNKENLQPIIARFVSYKNK